MPPMGPTGVRSFEKWSWRRAGFIPGGRLPPESSWGVPLSESMSMKSVAWMIRSSSSAR